MAHFSAPQSLVYRHLKAMRTATSLRQCESS
ncbi:hypothetical protein [Sphingobium sp. C100]